MPVYLFTYHAYRSWMPDHPGGFVQQGRGVQSPSAALANVYRQAATFPPVDFDDELQRLLIDHSIDICRRRRWRLHAVATEPTHLHILVSWTGSRRWQEVRGKLRNLLSLGLTRRFKQKGRPWFSTGASRKQVRTRAHFEHLMNKYLPNHGGARWFESRGWVTQSRPSGRG